MKELILLRHAKSDWGGEFLKDIDRPLNDRGYLDAYVLSEWYKNTKALPDLILSSTATRAMNTALIFLRTLELNQTSFQLEESIYESSVKNLISVIQQQNNKVQTLLLAGHNPGITELTNNLTPDLFFDNVPTCALISITFDAKKWVDLEPGKGKLNYYQYPKNYKNPN